MTTLRDMQRRDLDRVYELECRCFRTPWSKMSLRGELKNKLAKYLVYEEDGRVYGYCGMWMIFDEAHITNIAVDPERRREGIGKKILLGMMQAALLNGCTCMTLEVRETNYAAQALYRQFDFEKNGYRRGYYEDTGEGALILWNTDIGKTVAKFTEL